jgi:hypothetical protein
MAREVVTRYVSDVSGSEIKDEKQAVEIRISWPADRRKGTVVVDALESEVADLIKKGRKQKARGRAPGSKNKIQSH